MGASGLAILKPGPRAPQTMRWPRESASAATSPIWRSRCAVALNIPARYCNGYLGDIGVPADPSPMDFNAWFEVFLGGRWFTFDARHNQPRIGRILIARGRDAADIPMIASFGSHWLTCFTVVTEESRKPWRHRKCSAQPRSRLNRQFKEKRGIDHDDDSADRSYHRSAGRRGRVLCSRALCRNWARRRVLGLVLVILVVLWLAGALTSKVGPTP